MEQKIFDYLVEGLDLNAFYSFIDSKTDIDKNTPKFVFQYANCFLHFLSEFSTAFTSFFDFFSTKTIPFPVFCLSLHLITGNATSKS